MSENALDSSYDHLEYKLVNPRWSVGAMLLSSCICFDIKGVGREAKREESLIISCHGGKNESLG